MLDLWDPLLLARIQFAFTVSFHIIFPALTIGLASWLAFIEWRWLKTGDKIYIEIYRSWSKIFAVAFGMGVVSGVVMAYQFGTNWSQFSDKVGNVLGPLLGYEVLTAFFLEASFLGIMLFGWGRVSKKMHFVATMAVAIGTLVSAFWILSANSWMQTPQGFVAYKDGVLYPSSWLEIIFNPSFPYRFFHMITGAYLTTAFVVAGAGGYYILKRQSIQHGKIILTLAMLMILVMAPLQLIIGDMHGLNTLKYQPVKVAAMEGIWETQKGANLKIFGIPDEKEETTKYSFEIPKAASLVLAHSLDGEVKGLKAWPKDERPPVGPVFWSFRIMVAIGFLMILTGLRALYLYRKERLFTCKWFHRWCILMAPSGFIAILAGWMVTEIGRQPYIVYGIMRTLEAASPISTGEVAFSLIAFILVYAAVFGAGMYYILSLIKKGPAAADHHDEYYEHSLECAFATKITAKKH
jgi:cytochrome d ubiquinol oxidase subunit I